MRHAWLAASAFTLAALTEVSAAQGGPGPRPPHMPERGAGFRIVYCSLGCQRGPLGFTCTDTSIAVNEEVRIRFSRRVDAASVNSNTFRLIEMSTGNSPPGVFALDDHDRTLVYRPQLTFDSAGNPVFGLLAGHTYLLQVAGTDQNPLGPYLTSFDGMPNRTRLLCTLVASGGVADAVPGRPVASLFVDAVRARDPVTGEPVLVETVPAAGATDVLRSSPIRVVFDDLMNPATVANPVTGTSSFLRVFFDPDGNVQDRRDQVPVPGTFSLTLDQVGLSTTVLFRATGGLPASGTGSVRGKVVFEISPSVQDLAGNTVSNPGLTSFTTEAQ